MSTLNDDDLIQLLDELASSYDVPERGPDEIVAAIAEEPPAVPVLRRRWVQLSAAAAVIVAGAVIAASVYGGSDNASTKMVTAIKRAPGIAGAGEAHAPSAGGAVGPDSLQPQDSFTSTTSGSAASGGAAQFAPAAPAVVPAPAPAKALSAPAARSAVGSGSAAAGTAPGAAAPVSAAVGAPVPDDGDSRVVKSGTIALVVKDKRVTPTITAVTDAAKSYGGYVSDGSTQEYGDTPSGEVTLRVPVSHFEDLVAKVRGLDAKVRTASTSGKDVTAAYGDLESQLRTLRATRERFLLILSKTKTIGEILTVQQRVDNVSGQIDRLEGSRKLLAAQSDLSTLTVSVSEKDDPVARVATHRNGLSQALHDAKDGFVTGIESIVRHSGRALLWLICLTGLFLIARAGWKVARRNLV